MKVTGKHDKKVDFRGLDGEVLSVRYDNRGEPYREGISISYTDGENWTGVFLEEREARELKELIESLYPG